MYTELKESEITKDIGKRFKLCYIEKCQRTEYDKYGHEVELYDDDNTHLDLYFTNCPMNKQWGDDWNDAPYEHNAEIPYDDHYEGKERVEHEIIKTALTLKSNNGNGIGYYYHLPHDNFYNSPYSVDMINAGIVAWLYIDSDIEEISPGKRYIVIHGGDSITNVMRKLKKFKANG